MSKAGDWEMRPWKGGYPVWCELRYGGKELVRLRHTELRDLHYAIGRALKECRDELPESHKHEMD